MKVKYNGKPFTRQDVTGTAFAGENIIFKEAVKSGKEIEVDSVPENLKIIFEKVKSEKKSPKNIKKESK